MIETRSLGITVICVCAALLACKKSSGGDSAEPSGPPIFQKPIADLTKEEIGDACGKLGWQNSGVTFSSSTGFSNIMASCSKESPDGTASPDGKKRARLTIALYKDPATNVDRRKQQLEAEGAAYTLDGSTFLSVSLHTKSKDEAQKQLKRLVGK